MTDLRTHRWFTFVPSQSGKGIGVRKRSLPAMACIVVLFCAAAAIAAPAQSSYFTTLVNFDGTNGGNCEAPLIQATDGNFYGTTATGGDRGPGTVFRMTTSGTLTTLHSFDYGDGAYPRGGLLQAGDGNFYGTTFSWGNGGAGTVFRITPSGSLTTLANLYVDIGQNSSSALVQDGDGNFYGTAPESGTYDAGAVFKVTPAGSLTTLYSFCPWSGCPDGSTPYGGLVRGRDGNFYGTTVWGGSSNNCEGYGCGTVYKITPEGGLTTVHSFDGSDGDTPYSTLMQARDGNFYGTNYTFLFRMTPGGTVTTLNGEGNAENGCVDQLLQAADGNFYGTTVYGGPFAAGTVFEMNPSGTAITLHVFDGSDGSQPCAGLVQARDGLLYGTTSAGGSYGYGTVFRIGVPHTCATCRP